MSREWRLLITPAKHGAWNMAVDEAILEHIGRGESQPTLRLYAWEPACLSLGQAQHFSDVDQVRLSERGWDVVRRPTGGRAILHTDELTYSVIAPSDEPAVGGTLLESYNRLAAGLLHAVRALGLPADMKAGPKQVIDATNPVCFEAPSAYEITVDGKKLIGSAQARRREGVLQHGSLPLSGDLTRITQALVFETEEARQAAGDRLLRRATTAETVLGRPVGWDEAGASIRLGFESKLDLRFTPGALSETEAARTQELVHEKYAHAAWTRRM
jgi:lipoyl(octanoyl) transferase